MLNFKSNNLGGSLMPIYEYKCEKCGNIFEQLVMSSSKEDMQCPQCGNTRVKKLMSQSATVGQKKSAASCGPGTPSGFS